MPHIMMLLSKLERQLIFSTLSLVNTPLARTATKQSCDAQQQKEGTANLGQNMRQSGPQRQAKNRHLATVNHIYLKLQMDVAVKAIQTRECYIGVVEGKEGQRSMYEAYYGLREKPFSILPDPELDLLGAEPSTGLCDARVWRDE